MCLVKRILALIMAVIMFAAVLCGCGNEASGAASDNGNLVSATDSGNTGSKNKNGGSTDVSGKLSGTYEIAATDPHYIIFTPDWRAEGYGRGFALNEKGNKNYAIVAACGDGSSSDPLNESCEALYNDDFIGILMQNYRAKYAEFALETAEVKLSNGSTALRFSGIQPADDYGTELNCPVYGYGFYHDGVPFIIAYIVMDESAADDAKRAEMKDYVDEMVNTVRAAQ